MSCPFDGVWEIDLDRSLVWDDATQRHVRDEVGQERITLRIEGDVQDYEVLYGDGPKIRMGYTARYDDPQWVSYAVREVISDAQISRARSTPSRSGSRRTAPIATGRLWSERPTG